MIHLHTMPGLEIFNAYPGIAHFITTRYGGVGEGAYGTFNLTPYTGDKTFHVAQNRQILCEMLDIDTECLILPFQTHSVNIKVIDEAFLALDEKERHAALQRVDSIITDQKGICVAVSTADCVPLLIFDPVRQVVAAVHAGWRGTVKRIAANTVNKMVEQFGCKPSNIHVALGPSISVDAFEVGNEVYDAFSDAGFDMDMMAIYREETGKFHLDLWEANRQQLEVVGVPPQFIEITGICSYTNHEHFFSARRLGINSGRMLSGIMLRK